MSSQLEQHETERLLDQIRTQVAELHRLEQAQTDRIELRRRRREITELQWQLARFISQQSDGGNLAA
jgi:hypothetical protein